MDQESLQVSKESVSEAMAHASFLMSGIAWQESLLQSYRNYMVVTQSIFIAVAILLFNSQFNSDKLQEKTIFFITFIAISILGVTTLTFLSKAIKQRSESVDWWQKRLLKHEMSYINSRHLSTFNIAKEHQFKPPLVEAHILDEAEIEALQRIETPKARKVFGVFVPGFYLLWGLLIAISMIGFPWKNLVG